MLLRGGLLIEPWEQYVKYTSNPRKQSIISYNNNIYVCSVSHQSGATFEEHSSKFATIGGGGGSSLIPQGNWDIAYDTINGITTETTPILTSTYGATLNGNIVNSLQSYEYIAGGLNLYGASTNITNNFSNTKWITLSNTPNNYSLIFIYDIDAFPNPIDILTNTLTGTPLIGNYILIKCANMPLFSNFSWGISYNNSSNILINDGTNTTLPIGNISASINTTTNILTANSDTETVQIPLPNGYLSGINNIGLFVGGLDGGPLPQGMVEISFPDQINKPPFSNMRNIPKLPIGAEDGQLWNITSSGTYDNTSLNDGDSVIFYNNLENIIPIKTVDTQALINDSIINAISTNGTITVSVNATILEKKLIGYGGDWDASGQYNESLRFVVMNNADYFSEIVTIQGSGELQADGRYYGIVKGNAPTTSYPNLGFKFTLPNIASGDRLVVELRETGVFTSDVLSDKFCRFTFTINGNGKIITERTDSTNGIPYISGVESNIGDKISINISGGYIGAYSDTLEFSLNYSSVSFTLLSIEKYVGYGSDTPLMNHPQFFLSNGFKVLILPPTPYLFKTYNVINADSYSNFNGKLIKVGDKVTFILTDNNTQDILISPSENHIVEAQYGNYNNISLNSNNTYDSVALYIIDIDNTDVNDRVYKISTLTNISYSTQNGNYSGACSIFFNVITPTFSQFVGNQYIENSTYTITFDTRFGNAIQNVYISDLNGTLLPTISIPAESFITYTFTAVKNTTSSYGVSIICTGKVIL